MIAFAWWVIGAGIAVSISKKCDVSQSLKRNEVYCIKKDPNLCLRGCYWTMVDFPFWEGKCFWFCTETVIHSNRHNRQHDALSPLNVVSIVDRGLYIVSHHIHKALATTAKYSLPFPIRLPWIEFIFDTCNQWLRVKGCWKHRLRLRKSSNL